MAKKKTPPKITKKSKATDNKCKFCYKYLSSKQHLERHLLNNCHVIQQRQVDRKKNSLSCDGCDKSFNLLKNLRRHKNYYCHVNNNPTQITQSEFNIEFNSILSEFNEENVENMDPDDNCPDTSESDSITITPKTDKNLDNCPDTSESDLITITIKTDKNHDDTLNVDEVPTLDCINEIPAEILANASNYISKVNEDESCKKCQKIFKSKKSLKQHRCILDLKEDDIPFFEMSVLPSQEGEQLIKDLSCNTPLQIAHICLNGHFTLPGYFPYFFPQKVDIPILHEIGSANENAYKKINEAVQEGTLVIPKSYKINNNGQCLYIQPPHTIPHDKKSCKNLEITVTDTSVSVSLKEGNRGIRGRLLPSKSSTMDTQTHSGKGGVDNSNESCNIELGLAPTGGINGRSPSPPSSEGSRASSRSRSPRRHQISPRRSPSLPSSGSSRDSSPSSSPRQRPIPPRRSPSQPSSGGSNPSPPSSPSRSSPPSSPQRYIPPRQQFHNTCKFRNPHFNSADEMRDKIKIWPHEFRAFCLESAIATRPNNILSHEARVFLYLFRINQGCTFKMLEWHFDIATETARHTYLDIFAYFVLFDPHIPSIFDDNSVTEAEIEGYLFAIRDSQSPGIRRIVETMRTPDGRPVVVVNDDTTHLSCPKSNDPENQKDHFSGRRNKGHCELNGGLATCNGSIIALRPSGHISSTPRGGDAVTVGTQLGFADRHGLLVGFQRLLRGTNAPPPSNQSQTTTGTSNTRGRGSSRRGDSSQRGRSGSRQRGRSGSRQGSRRGRSGSQTGRNTRSPSPTVGSSSNPRTPSPNGSNPSATTTSTQVSSDPGVGLNGGAKPGMGCVYNTDRGFLYVPHNVTRGTDPIPIDWCDANNVLMVCPWKEGERAFRYHRATNRLYIILDNDDPVLAANSARICQYLRPASENYHAAMKSYKLFSGTMDQHFFDPVGQGFVNRYSHRYGVQMDPSWAEVSMASIHWIAATGLFNRFHPKFARRFPAEFQVEIAERILFNLETPNIILDDNIEFIQNIHAFPTATNIARANLPGYNTFPCGSQVDIIRLNLPVMDPGDNWELFLLAGGEYTMNRGMGILTAAREWELRQQRAADLLGTTANYTQLASQLPQTLPVFFFRQQVQPTNYDATLYGQWPGPCVVLKMALPSSNRSMASNVSHRCVTLIISDNPVSPQIFNLRGHLSRYFGYHCTCESGMRTNSACEHIQAFNILLFSPHSFITAKRQETRISDVRRPEAHRPVLGAPTGQRNRQVQLQPAPRPAPRTRDTRQQKRQHDFRNFVIPPTGTGSTTPSTAATRSVPAMPTTGTGSTTPSTAATRSVPAMPTTRIGNPAYVHYVPHISGLGGLMNHANTCYGISVVQLLTCIGYHNNIVIPALPGNLQTLSNRVVIVCGQRANVAIPPFNIIPLINDLNVCLQPVQRFALGQQEDAAEFLHYLMDKVDERALFMAINHEQGNCGVCGGHEIQVSQSLEAYALAVVPPQQAAPVPLSPLIVAKIAAPIMANQLRCTTAGPCQGLPIQQVRIVEQAGINKIYHVSRNVNNVVKILTPIIEPAFNDPSWIGKYCKCVIAHCGRQPGAGHYISFIKQGGAAGLWYKVDDMAPIILENPFIGQLNPAAIPARTDYTIDLLLFTT